MKKSILFSIAILCVASSAFAEYVFVENGAQIGTTTGGQTTVKGSKGVKIEYVSETNGGQGYVLGSFHNSGTQTFGTSSGDTKIYKQDATNVSVPTPAPVGSATVDFSAWKPM